MSEMSESLKKEIADFVTTYTDIKLSQLAFVKTAIAKVTGVGTTKGNKISIAGLAEYDDIQSLGDVIYPNDSIVFVIAPNNQWSNSYIQGQLFATPANIKGGSIDIGDGEFTVDENGDCIANSFTSSSANITGGEINITTDSTSSAIKLYYDSGTGDIRQNSFSGYSILSDGYIDGHYVDVLIEPNQINIIDDTLNYYITMKAESVDFNSGATNKISLNTPNGSIVCVSLTQTSLEEFKKEIELCPSVINIIKDSEIYSYKFNDDKDYEINNRYGFVIGKNRNTPLEVLGQGGKGIDTYNMASINWKATQELIAITESQQQQLDSQQSEINQLKQQIEELKSLIVGGGITNGTNEADSING